MRISTFPGLVILVTSCSSSPRWPATCTLASDELRAELVALARACKLEFQFEQVEGRLVVPRVARKDNLLHIRLDNDGVDETVGDFWKYVDRWYRRERVCCPFLKMSLDHEPDAWALDIWTDPPCPAALDEYQEIFSP
jgi:hypothetical protein